MATAMEFPQYDGPLAEDCFYTYAITEADPGFPVAGGVSKHEFPGKTPNWNFALFPTWSSKEFKMEFKCDTVRGISSKVD